MWVALVFAARALPSTGILRLNLHLFVNSAAAAAAYQRSNMENYFKTEAWDLYLCKLQSYYKFYALKKPILYQDKKYGGFEELTKFILTRYAKNNGSIYLRKKTISNLMSSNNN